jgi:hypothetical protein
MLADGLSITQVVIPVDKAPVEFFERGAPHHEDGERQKQCQRNFTWGIVNLDPDRPFLSPCEPRGNPFLRRKGDMPLCMELEKETPANHVLGGSIGLCPIPEAAKLLR